MLYMQNKNRQFAGHTSTKIVFICHKHKNAINIISFFTHTAFLPK